MILRELKLTNFRNYGSAQVEWSPGVNMIRGNNAQGKTNLLEAIGFLSTFSSFRKSSVSELIKKERDFFLIRSTFYASATEHTMNVAYSAEKKYKVRLDGVDKKRVAPLVGFLNAVVFSPDDLMLMKGRPEDRRRFLDGEIIQTAPESHVLFSRYQKALKHRNMLLKNYEYRHCKDMLAAYDQQLAECGALILIRRKDVIERLLPLVRLAHRRITDGNEELLLDYEGGIPGFFEKKHTFDQWKDAFLEKLEECREADFQRGATTFGPHRDDIRFFINGDDIRHFGSQGQQRTASLALKIGELELMKGQRGEYPVLLLDDVLSELDEKRREALISAINGKVQTFVTDTGSEKLFTDAVEYRVKEGNICLL
ncbi:MAG: DNA replication/repair protein RecF [Firmicutes bacterium]|nr:DNA replication/repair protein RecF [Bacillota bacterium]